MKRLMILIIAILSMSIMPQLLISNTAYADPIDIYSRDSFETGDGALTALSGASLETGDIAYVKIQDDENYGSGLFIFFYVADSGAQTAAPNIYKPSTGTTDGRWIRVTPYIEAGDIPSMNAGTNPTPVSIYNLSHDTNGTGGTNDRIIRAIDSAGNQWPVGQRLVSIPINFTKPQAWSADRRDFWEVWENVTGMTFTITEIRCSSDISTSIVFKTSASLIDATISKTIGTININAARTSGGYYQVISTLTNYTIAAGELLVLDFHDTDDPDGGQCTVKGVFNAAQ
jgi:hypothetical protein